jgi:hypothetical protein
MGDSRLGPLLWLVHVREQPEARRHLLSQFLSIDLHSRQSSSNTVIAAATKTQQGDNSFNLQEQQQQGGGPPAAAGSINRGQQNQNIAALGVGGSGEGGGLKLQQQSQNEPQMPSLGATGSMMGNLFSASWNASNPLNEPFLNQQLLLSNLILSGGGGSLSSSSRTNFGVLPQLANHQQLGNTPSLPQMLQQSAQQAILQLQQQQGENNNQAAMNLFATAMNQQTNHNSGMGNTSSSNGSTTNDDASTTSQRIAAIRGWFPFLSGGTKDNQPLKSGTDWDAAAGLGTKADFHTTGAGASAAKTTDPATNNNTQAKNGLIRQPQLNNHQERSQTQGGLQWNSNILSNTTTSLQNEQIRALLLGQNYTTWPPR